MIPTESNITSSRRAMREKFSAIYLAFFSLIVIWFLVILSCLPPQVGQENPQTWPSEGTQEATVLAKDVLLKNAASQGPLSQDQAEDTSVSLSEAREFVSLTKALLLFYQFNFNDTDDQSLSSIAKSSVSREEHWEASIKLGLVNDHVEEHVEEVGYELFAFNLLASNRAGLIRPLPDTRNHKCPHWRSSARNQTSVSGIETSQKETNARSSDSLNLQASVIICFFNEAPSALLRTIYTVIYRSPRRLLREIIVVDDFSESSYDSSGIKTFIDSPLVKFVRTTRREGLIRARLIGAGMASGDTLVFLDSHVEANQGWLEPLLEALARDEKLVACPMIDLINAESLIYTASPMVKGGLDWALGFKWDSIPSAQLKSYDDFVKPVESASMAGGLYAIKRDYFHKLGSYDPGMNLWGGENIEMSLRTWMCGGKVVILPCSRVGHIFRKRRPYGPAPGEPDSWKYNSRRTALVWLNEEGKDYLDKFFEANEDTRHLDSGDVQDRLELRRKLNCHNFTWFIENVYPKLKTMDTDGKVDSRQSTQSPERPIVRPAIHTKSRRFDRSANYQPSESGDVHRGLRIVPTKPSQAQTDQRSQVQQEGPDEQPQFQIRSTGSNLCIESHRVPLAQGFKRLALNQCLEIRRDPSSGQLIATINGTVTTSSTIKRQIWTETKHGDYRLDGECLDVMKNLPLLRHCHRMGSFQEWSRLREPSAPDIRTNTTNSTLDPSIMNQFLNLSIYNSGNGGFSGLCLGVELGILWEPLIVTLCDNAPKPSRREIVKSIGTTPQSDSPPNQQNKPKPRNNHRKRQPSWFTGDFSVGLELGRPLRPNTRWDFIMIPKMGALLNVAVQTPIPTSPSTNHTPGTVVNSSLVSTTSQPVLAINVTLPRINSSASNNETRN